MVRYKWRKRIYGSWEYLLVQLVMAFFKNKNVAVVGGGNTAVEEALFLSNLCKKFSLFIEETN